MTNEIFWIHDKALTNPPKGGHPIFVWDDGYFQNRAYSLKRLVFIYETLCQMQVDIIKGDLMTVMAVYAPQKITTCFTADTMIKQQIEKLSALYKLEVTPPFPFVQLPEPTNFTRFFKYWNKAQKTAFMVNGGHNAKGH